VLLQQESQAKLKKKLKPGTPKYEETKDASVEEMINGVWIQGEAEELGVVVTDKQVEAELEKIKKENFPTKEAYDKFLDEANFAPADVNERIKLQLLGTAVQEKVKEEAPEPSPEAIKTFYEEEKETRFKQKENRDVRFISNEDKSKAEAALKELEKDNSPAGWKKTAAKYSSDSTTKTKGGLQEGIQEEFFQEPSQEEIKKAIFDAATGELSDVIKYEKNYFVIEVVKLNPAKTKSLKEAESEIKAALAQETQQEFFTAFIGEFEGKWRGRTYCDQEFLVKQCSNYTGSGHPSSAPPACYEANPKTPATACPAPVPMTQPTLPGKVTLLKPKGEPFVQRPLPEAGAEAGAAEGAASPEGAAPPPEGAAPPPEEGAAEAEPPGE
jgi:parvulin-like peptidyl-prolyl isomerase